MVTLLNACIDASNKGSDKAQFCAKFSEFEDAICEHIKNEETVMTGLGYFDSDADMESHKKGAQIFRELSKECQLNIETEVILKQATKALLELMLKTDLGFKAYLDQIGYQEP